MVIVLALYLFVIGRCLWIAADARDGYSRLLAGALAMTFFVYVIVNGGMVVGAAAGGRRADAAAELWRHLGGVVAGGTRRRDVGARASTRAWALAMPMCLCCQWAAGIDDGRAADSVFINGKSRGFGPRARMLTSPR